MPAEPLWLPREQILRREEIVELAGVFVGLGVNRIRLTGGEPLLRRDVVDVTAALNELRERGLRRLSMTSNASRMHRFADRLADAGLDDVNISIDLLDPVRFAAETGGELQHVLNGIDAALAAGLGVKLNAVAIADYNIDEIVPLVEWAMAEDLELRIIEFMPLDGIGGWRRGRVVSEAKLLAMISERHTIETLPRTGEPSTTHLIDGWYRLGVISTITNPFCGSCDRLRLTADGGLFNCLFSPRSFDLASPLRAGAESHELAQLIRNHVWHKERGFNGGYTDRAVTMHGLGG